jgi:hypothetical protein
VLRNPDKKPLKQTSTYSYLMGMRKATLVTAIMLIIILMVPMEQGVIVRASYSEVESIRIESPQNQEYKTSSINVSVVVETNNLDWLVFWGSNHLKDITYFLDGKPCAPPYSTKMTNLSLLQHDSDYFGTGTLNNLTDGYHTLKVRVEGLSPGNSLASTIFLVNTTGYHTPEILSPLNTTYSKNNVPLTCTNEEKTYSVYYKLDNSNYSTITSNTTLSDLSKGQHTISIKAMNSDILYSEQTTNFTVSPKLLLSPLDANYTQNNVSLTYTVDNPQYLVYYKLDNSTFISLTSNTTLSDLAEGNHTITVKATDRNETTLYAEQTANFTVDTTGQTLATVVAVTLGILAIASVLAVTYRRRKLANKQTFL